MSGRFGWNGEMGSRPLRTWLNVTHWDTFAEATGTVADPDGGTLSFEVDQGPAYAWTYGAGFSYGPRRWINIAVDTGTDFHGGWYLAVVPGDPVLTKSLRVNQDISAEECDIARRSIRSNVKDHRSSRLLTLSDGQLITWEK